MKYIGKFVSLVIVVAIMGVPIVQFAQAFTPSLSGRDVVRKAYHVKWQLDLPRKDIIKKLVPYRGTVIRVGQSSNSGGTVVGTNQPSVSQGTNQSSVSRGTVVGTNQPSVSQGTIVSAGYYEPVGGTVVGTNQPSVSQGSVVSAGYYEPVGGTVVGTNQPSVSQGTVVGTNQPSVSQGTVVSAGYYEPVVGSVVGTNQPSVSQGTVVSTSYYEPVGGTVVSTSYYEPVGGTVVSTNYYEPVDDIVVDHDDDLSDDDINLDDKVSKCGRPYPDDIDGHWAEIYVRRLYDLCIVEGYGDGTFRPERFVSRAELVKMVLYSKNVEPKQGCYDADCGSPFVDLDMWQGPWIRKAWDLGVVQGYSRNEFRPNQAITRAEAVKVILVVYGYSPLNVSKSFFNDVSGWSIGWIERAHEVGLVQGIGNGNFDPDRPITRAESAKVIAKMMEHWDTKILE